MYCKIGSVSVSIAPTTSENTVLGHSSLLHAVKPSLGEPGKQGESLRPESGTGTKAVSTPSLVGAWFIESQGPFSFSCSTAKKVIRQLATGRAEGIGTCFDFVTVRDTISVSVSVVWVRTEFLLFRIG